MSAENPLAIVLPGQGVQGHVPDLVNKLFFHKEPEVVRTVEGIYTETKHILGVDLREISQAGSLEELSRPGILEPAIMTASIALLEVLREHYGITPDVVAGHSMGQVTASYGAGALDLEQAQLLLKGRGEFMAEAGAQNPGRMAAILGLTFDQVLTVCEKFGVVLANANSPTQNVISGEKDAVAEASKFVRDQAKRDKTRVRAVELEINVAAHSYFMQPARERMKSLLQRITISDPLIPIVDNSSAERVTTKEGVAFGLIESMTARVLWQLSIENMVAHGDRVIMEVGPGNVLSNTISRIDPSVSVIHGLQIINPGQKGE